MITYGHAIHEKTKETLVNELWEYEINFISHKDIIYLAKRNFTDTLNKLDSESLLKHYNEVIGQ